MIAKIFDCLINILALIIEGNGANYLVETKRGVKWKKMNLPEENENEQTISTSVPNWTEIFHDDAEEKDI